MKKIILTVLIFHCSLTIANAQWVQMPNGMGDSSTVYSLASLGTNIFAGTFGNGVYISTNNGTSWIQTALNNKNIWSLATLGNNIFSGTLQYGVYLSSNNGISWVQTTLNNQNVRSLLTLGNNIFAGTWNGVYLSTDNGTNWTQTSLNNEYFSSLATLGNSIFSGTGYHGIYLSNNNGASWIQTALNNQNIWSLATIGNNIFAGTFQNGVYLSSNNGTTWAQTGLNNKNVLSLVTLGNSIFAGTEYFGIYLSTNNGTNWIQKNQGFNNIPLVDALLVTNNYIYAGTGGNSVWRRSLSEIIGINNISTEVPKQFNLFQNYPNPFNPSTKIKFDIPANLVGQTFLSVYDISGREIQTLVNEKLNPGTYEVTFDGSNFASGVYFYQLRTGDFIETKKLVLLK